MFPLLAVALQQEGGGGNPLKTLGFILVCVFGGAAFWMLFIAEAKTALGSVCAVITVILLWTMAGLPLPNINRQIFNGEGAFIAPFFASVAQRPAQARRTIITGLGIAAICAYMGAWLYIPLIALGVAVSCWPQLKLLPALAINYVRRSR